MGVWLLMTEYETMRMGVWLLTTEYETMRMITLLRYSCVAVGTILQANGKSET